MIISDRLQTNIKKGDIVKFRSYPTNCSDEYVYHMGVVMSDVMYTADQQIPMWPSVNVYSFDSGTVRECGASSLEIISTS